MKSVSIFLLYEYIFRYLRAKRDTETVLAARAMHLFIVISQRECSHFLKVYEEIYVVSECLDVIQILRKLRSSYLHSVCNAFMVIKFAMINIAIIYCIHLKNISLKDIIFPL